MSDDLLRRAVAVAKQGDRKQAIQLTKQYIKANKDDARGWYALAKLVDDDEVQKKALRRVLQLNPNHTKARTMLDELEQPSSFPDMFSFDDDEDNEPDDLFTSSTYADNAASVYDDSPFDDDAPAYQSRSSASEADAADALRKAEASRANRQPAKVRNKQGGGSTGEFIIGAGVLILAIAALIGLGYYAYYYQHMGLFGLFGPDLSELATSTELRVRYPGDWEADVSDKVIVAGTYGLSARFSCFSSNDSIVGAILFQGLSGEAGARFEEQEFQMLILPVDTELMDEINACGLTSQAVSSGRELIEVTVSEGQNINESGSGFEIKAKSDLKATTIAGVDGLYGYATIYINASDFGNEVSVGTYLASFMRNDQEYLFILNIVGKGAHSQTQLAERILRSIEFVN